ncbi:MAG: TadE/TadG family type IV pilus assembly protein [Mycobacterium leprae]
MGKQHGAATLELLLALPIVLLLLFGSLMMGYYLYVKLVLNWNVYERSEELAVRGPYVGVVDSAVGVVRQNNMAGLSAAAKGNSFAVPAGSRAFTIAVACQPVPVSLPRFDFGDPKPRAAPLALTGNLLNQASQLITSARGYLKQGTEIADQVDDLADDALLVRQLAVELTAGPPDSRFQGIRQLGGWAAEAGVGALRCRVGNNLVVTAKAVVWNEKTKALSAAPYGLGD